MFSRSLILLMLLSLFSLQLLASEEVPDEITILTAPEVKEQLDGQTAQLIHVLSRIEYAIQHIPGSINIPLDELSDSAKLPSDKTAGVVFYCNGEACPYSLLAAKKAIDLGYQQIYWFRGGILEWRKFGYEMVVNRELMQAKVKKLNPEKFQQADTGNALILDVRPKWWRKSNEQSGLIPGTDIMIPLLDLDELKQQLPKDRPILLVDRLMRQSIHAAKYLINHGYQVEGVLMGGSKRWVSEGLPVMPQNEEPDFTESVN